MSKYKGSLRCVLDLVSSTNFIIQINSLIKTAHCSIDIYDHWMPKSYNFPEEAELKDFLPTIGYINLGNDIRNWWLSVSTSNTRTPNWDLLSTCKINGVNGILLVEAKAHCGELEKEGNGKKLLPGASLNSQENHKKIGDAIKEANFDIAKIYSSMDISRDKCYQLSNRVAHAWWLASQGIPVVLLYLGFLDVQDMDYNNNQIFRSHSDWDECFRNHAKKVNVDQIINKKVNCGKSSFHLLVGSL